MRICHKKADIRPYVHTNCEITHFVICTASQQGEQAGGGGCLGERPVRAGAATGTAPKSPCPTYPPSSATSSWWRHGKVISPIRKILLGFNHLCWDMVTTNKNISNINNINNLVSSITRLRNLTFQIVIWLMYNLTTLCLAGPVLFSVSAVMRRDISSEPAWTGLDRLSRQRRGRVCLTAARCHTPRSLPAWKKNLPRENV